MPTTPIRAALAAAVALPVLVALPQGAQAATATYQYTVSSSVVQTFNGFSYAVAQCDEQHAVLTGWGRFTLTNNGHPTGEISRPTDRGNPFTNQGGWLYGVKASGGSTVSSVSAFVLCEGHF